MFDFLTDEMIMVWFSVFHLVGMSSTCTNPVLYGFLNESISQEMLRKIRKLGRHLQVTETQLSILSTGFIFLGEKSCQ